MTGPGGAPPVTPNTVPAVIRTVVPLVVGTVLAWLASRGLDLTAYENAVNVFLPPFLGSLYYAAVFAAEKRWPWVGWLLGYAKQPQYIDPTGQPVPAPYVDPGTGLFTEPGSGTWTQAGAAIHGRDDRPYTGEHRRPDAVN